MAIRTVAASYAYFDAKATRWEAVPALYAADLRDVKNRDEFIALLERVLDELYDPHAQLTVNLERSPRLVPSGTDLWAEWREDGATITQVRDHSDAARAGLRPGAVVVRFDGMPIGDAVEAAPLALWNCPQAISSPAGGRPWTPPRFDLVSATFASTIRSGTSPLWPRSTKRSSTCVRLVASSSISGIPRVAAIRASRKGSWAVSSSGK